MAAGLATGQHPRVQDAGLQWVQAGCPHPATSQPLPQASQVNDAHKYAVTQALVRVLATNRHPPRFARPTYRAFVPAGARQAALLLTFGGHVLALHAHDPDFPEVGADRVRAGDSAGRDLGKG